ncbi:origin of replication complex subunit 6 [Canna indica]|uniref:Origin of replication complex subunit 6 n=1 Tax=Canna indica TaxID=4628 RepID=A0AAQ3KSZ8_9LILI|nr:origin of replication complex subunit 6 [Canna indica]
MDFSAIASRLGLANSKPLIRKAGELRRLSDLQFDSSIIGVVSPSFTCRSMLRLLCSVPSNILSFSRQGEVAKAIICMELAASRFGVVFDRQTAIKMSGMSEKAYMRSLNAMQTGIGVKPSLDIRQLGIQFGCVRLIPFVQKGLSLYKDRVLTALPPSRRASTDFSRPVFTAVAFYLCAKRHKLKVDKMKLIDLCGTSESEFVTVSNSMIDLCFDVFGISKEKKDSKAVKGHRELLDALPGKRKREDDGDASDDSSGEELSSYKRHKKMEKHAYDKWKVSVISSNKQDKTAPLKPKKQATLNFKQKSPGSIALEAVSDGFSCETKT